MASLGQWDMGLLDFLEVRGILGYLACQGILDFQVRKGNLATSTLLDLLDHQDLKAYLVHLETQAIQEHQALQEYQVFQDRKEKEAMWHILESMGSKDQKGTKGSQVPKVFQVGACLVSLVHKALLVFQD